MCVSVYCFDGEIGVVARSRVLGARGKVMDSGGLCLLPWRGEQELGEVAKGGGSGGWRCGGRRGRGRRRDIGGESRRRREDRSSKRAHFEQEGSAL